MNALMFTAITNIILACEGFLLTGILLGRSFSCGSAPFAWTMALAAMSCGSFIGGIDHGFFESRGPGKARTVLQRSTWILIALMTFFAERTAILLFAPSRLAALLTIAAAVQFSIAAAAALLRNKFLFTIINYSLPMILLLILSLITGKGGIYLPAGILLSFAASALQTARVKISPLVDHNGLYHLIMMAAVVLLYEAAYYL